ncbi:hypothetical protein CISG_06596 [Coccidioides immitis RMSCC 3703]|uniref:Uncharacterized protein n=2 Tax=Coccidioides immitis TaxID=5501 RepID=A0A0J8R1Z5_COCIT|nr:hypothetical protein CIRG_05852 [Coccidioides immitis RMSCC 2394]KMU78360.1 hypothetical protein CISG_06596 [Coccidioides immitis RMSCC 3703]
MEVGPVWPRAIQEAGLDSFKSRNPRNRNMPYEGNTIEPPTRNYSRWRVGSLVLGGSQTHINGHEAQAACHWWRHQGTWHFELQNPRDKDRQTKVTDRHAHKHTHRERERERVQRWRSPASDGAGHPAEKRLVLAQLWWWPCMAEPWRNPSPLAAAMLQLRWAMTSRCPQWRGELGLHIADRGGLLQLTGDGVSECDASQLLSTTNDDFPGENLSAVIDGRELRLAEFATQRRSWGSQPLARHIHKAQFIPMSSLEDPWTISLDPPAELTA